MCCSACHTQGPDGKLTLVAESKGEGKIVLEDLDHVLMATGRKPNTRNLGCEEVRLPNLASRASN